MTDLILIAEIANAHGIKGQVKLNFYGEDKTLLKNPLFLDEQGTHSVKVTLQGKVKKQLIASIDGVTDRNTSETYKGRKLYISKDHIPAPKNDEALHIDLIGKPTYDATGEYHGDVVAVQNFGAGDLLEIKPKGGGTFLLPFTKICVPEIKDDRLVIDMPEYI